MAQPTADEELQLKQRARRRLIGAIVLVMVVVLGLPMVLDTEPKPASQDVDIRIPSPDSGAFKSKIVPIAPAPDAKAPAKPPEAMAQPGSAATVPDSTPKEAPASKAAPRVATTPPSKPEADAKEKTSRDKRAKEKAAKETSATNAQTNETGAKEALPPAATAEGPRDDAKQAPRSRAGAHVVQVTALLNADKAKEIHEQMRAAGVKSYTEVVSTAKGEVTRVRAGPFATREEAEKARAQLQTLGLDGKVTAR